MQQIISKGFVIVKEVLSDLFELRNVVNLIKNSLQKKMEIPRGWGGPQMTLWKGNSKGVGGKNQRTIRGGGMDIFWNHTLGENFPNPQIQYCRLCAKMMEIF